jgi:hypothetical protein
MNRSALFAGVAAALVVGSLTFARDARVFPLSPISSGGSGGSGGSGVTALQHGLSLSGTTGSCNSAGASDAGCVTPDSQTFAGDKTFTGIIRGTGNYFGYSAQFNESITGKGMGAQVVGPLTFNPAQSFADPGADFVIRNSFNGRDAGYAFQINDYWGCQVTGIQSSGDVIFGPSCEAGGVSPTSLTKGSLRDGSGLSGHIALRASSGLYLTIAGDLPAAYGGVHGATTVSNGTQMDGGFMLQILNGPTVGLWDWQGGWSQISGIQRSQFQQCGRTGSGTALTGAFDGTIMFGADDSRWHQCTTSDAGWPVFVLQPEVLGVAQSPSNGSYTSTWGSSTLVGGAKTVAFTVAFSAAPEVCFCTDTTGAFACGVTSKTASSAAFAGTGTNTFDWQCIGKR